MKTTKKPQIDYRYVNPFITSAVYIIRQTTDLQVKRKNLYTQQGKKSVGGMHIQLDIFGDIQGRVVYELSRGVTVRIATRMIEKSMIDSENPEDFKHLLESAILELTNQITGRAVTILQNYKINCTITPPILTFGKTVTLIDESIKIIVVDMATLFGEFKINLGIQWDENK